MAQRAHGGTRQQPEVEQTPPDRTAVVDLDDPGFFAGAQRSLSVPGIEAIRLSLRPSGISGAVVSSTETRKLVPPTSYFLLSMRMSSASEKAETSALAANISVA